MSGSVDQQVQDAPALATPLSASLAEACLVCAWPDPEQATFARRRRTREPLPQSWALTPQHDAHGRP